MISTFFNRILLVTIISFSAWVNANQFDNPYQGNVMVESFDEDELKEMTLKQVLIKVSGNLDIVNRAETKLLMTKTQQMLSQYSYRKYQGEDYFSAVFDKRKINQALKDMQQPVWGDTRPTTLIWLIKNNKLISDHAIKQSNDSPLSWGVQQAEHQRGIRVQFPLMDLDDNLVVSVSDVRGHFYDQVAQASMRYGRAHFVVAELKALNSNKWRLNWQLVQSNKNAQQNNVLVSEEFVGGKAYVTGKMMNALADYYAQQYAILENQGEKFAQTIHIEGINSLQELTQLNRVLDNLFAISSFKITSTQGTQVSVKVKINGGLNSFKNALIVQPNLQLDTTIPATSEILPVSKDNEDETLTDGNKVEAVKTEALYFNWR